VYNVLQDWIDAFQVQNILAILEYEEDPDHGGLRFWDKYMFARFSGSQARDEVDEPSAAWHTAWCSCPNMFGVQAMTYQPDKIGSHVQGPDGRSAQIDWLKATTQMH